MNKKDFTALLEAEGIQYKIQKGIIIIKKNGGNVDLRLLTTLPSGIKFENGGYVDLRLLTTLPSGIKFENGRDVDLSSLTSLPSGIKFENGRDVYLSSLTSLPSGIKFENGGNVDLSSERISIQVPYLQRFGVPKYQGKYILYKRVSNKFQTQENTPNETTWKIKKTNQHPKWEPQRTECGAGKYHACAKPSWCDSFRSIKGDRYIAIAIEEDDLYEWKNNPNYPQKIGFRKGTVLYEVDRYGKKVKA